jgi:hypothetical protein
VGLQSLGAPLHAWFANPPQRQPWGDQPCIHARNETHARQPKKLLDRIAPAHTHAHTHTPHVRAGARLSLLHAHQSSRDALLTRLEVLEPRQSIIGGGTEADRETVADQA